MAKPFRVIHSHVFGPGVTEKAKCRKRVVECSENPCFPNIPLSFYGPSPRNPWKYPHKSSISRNWSHWVIFVAESISLSSFKFLWWAPKDARVLKQSAERWSRSSKVVDFGTSWKRVWNFLLVLNSNLGPMPRFSDIRAFVRQQPHFPHPTLGRKFWDVPCGVDHWWERTPRLSNREIIFE